MHADVILPARDIAVKRNDNVYFLHKPSKSQQVSSSQDGDEQLQLTVHVLPAHMFVQPIIPNSTFQATARIQETVAAFIPRTQPVQQCAHSATLKAIYWRYRPRTERKHITGLYKMRHALQANYVTSATTSAKSSGRTGDSYECSIV